MFEVSRRFTWIPPPFVTSFSSICGDGDVRFPAGFVVENREILIVDAGLTCKVSDLVQLSIFYRKLSPKSLRSLVKISCLFYCKSYHQHCDFTEWMNQEWFEGVLHFIVFQKASIWYVSHLL